MHSIDHLPAHHPVDEGALDSEEASIKFRDIFGTHVVLDESSFESRYDDDYDETESNPFVTFLRNALAQATRSDAQADTPHWAEKLRWFNGSSPQYRICAEEARAIVGDDSEATDCILSGVAELHKLPDGSPAERAAWPRDAGKQFSEAFGFAFESLPAKVPS